MPITAGWDNPEQTIYCVQMRGSDWIWPQFGAEIDRAYRLIEMTGRTVDFVMAFYDVLPLGNALGYLSVAGSQPANVRHTVIVNNASPFLELLVRSVDRARGWEGPQFVDSFEAARAYLAARARQSE